tara:strand:- start:423 stop:566 length:144 start_codon:yes stop_codon:yes gene_type:complete
MGLGNVSRNARFIINYPHIIFNSLNKKKNIKKWAGIFLALAKFFYLI